MRMSKRFAKKELLLNKQRREEGKRTKRKKAGGVRKGIKQIHFVSVPFQN